MKRFVLCLLGCWIAFQVSAAESPWLTSIPDAKAQAKKDNKLVLVNFTGLDWCPPCKAMEADTYTKPDFLNYAKSNLVLVMLDFYPTKKQPEEVAKSYDAIRKDFKVEGFPTVFLINPAGDVLWKKEGLLAGGPKAMIAELQQAGNTKKSATH